MKCKYIILTLFLVGTLLSCQDDPKTPAAPPEAPQATPISPPTPPPPPAATTPTPPSDGTAAPLPEAHKSLSDGSLAPNPNNIVSPKAEAAATTEGEESHPYRDISVGTITNACQLISEEEIRKQVPGFANVRELRLMPRNSPDNHASACECRAVNEGLAFVVGYRKNPRNYEYIDEIIDLGEIREYAPNIPPYDPVEGLAVKAAFNTKHGYLKWVGDNGVLVYAYVHPTTIQNVDMNYKALYSYAQKIDARFNAK